MDPSRDEKNPEESPLLEMDSLLAKPDGTIELM